MTNTAHTETETMNRSFEIPSVNVATLKAGLDKLAKKAIKLGLTPPTYKVVGDRWVESYDDATQLTSERHFVIVEVTGEAPVLAGDWQLAAVLQPIEGAEGCVIRVSPFYEGEIPEEHRHADPKHCDHCGYSRKRNEVFLVSSVEEGFKAVGRQCLGDFLGHHSPQELARAAQYLQALIGVCEEAGESFGGVRDYVLTIDYLAHVQACIRADGWRSRAKVEETGGEATTDTAQAVLFCPPHRRETIRPELLPTGTDRKKAEETLQWAREHFGARTGLNDYEWNLSQVVQADEVPNKGWGLLASIFSYQDRVLEWERKAARRAEEAHQGHLGAEGEQIILYVQLERVTAIEGVYGTTFLHSFLTAEDPDRRIDLPANAAVAWFASRGLFETDPLGFESRVEPGSSFYLVGTVKKHGEYNGVPQTQMTRCNMVAAANFAAVQKSTEKKNAAKRRKAQRS